ncbi:MAG: alanine--tRNA ligase, partial [Oscillospiraceae bacterium]|nr:alanine--tRNA ligase [Oscillospiraceae bacterium]
IDTGMGLERLAVACQDVPSLFDVDTVMNITNKVTEITGASYGMSRKKDVSLRVITDHIRASVFMIADGVLPSNEGRGYVLRRLLRRAARHGKLLGVDKPFLCDVVETVVRENEGHYPYLRERDAYITRVVRVEEENFAKTIDGGMKIYEEMLAVHKETGEKVFSGADAFKLYDTYGFPIDLTIEMAKEESMEVDLEGFKALMQEQKERAREARKALGDLGWTGMDFGQEIPETAFVGYENTETKAKILAIVAEDEARTEIAEGVEAVIVLDQTVMYAEMGGQVADQGTIETESGLFTVTDVQKNKGGKYMHYGVVSSGALKLDDECCVCIDVERRKAICRAHSATHLLQTALTRVLGEHCHQAGSLVEPDHLRFDFTHFSAVSTEELTAVGSEVMEMILKGENVETLILPVEEAKKLGATALFGEKYGDTVRVVKMGEDSMEFCGGTHLDNTAKVGPFRIMSEASVASGVRRIEAYTGKNVMQQMENFNRVILRIAEELKTTPKDVLSRARNVVTEVKELRQNIERMKDKLASGEIDQVLASARDVSGLRVLTGIRKDMEIADLRKMGDLLRDKAPDLVAVFASLQGEKISVLAVCGKEAVAKGIKAGTLVKEVCAVCGGSGGGKPDSAMGGGKDATMLDDALAIVDNYVQANVK